MPKNVLPALIVLLLLGLYIANCFTPLRLTNDTVRYLNLKEWLEAGKPENQLAAKDFFPYGYVWFLMLLEKLHLARSFFIGFFQLLYLLGSVWFIHKIFGEAVQRWQLLVMCLLSWASLKFVIIPLSEMQFLFFSMGALYFFHEWQKGKRAPQILLAIIFAAVAIVTRTIGIVLLAAFVISFLWRNRSVIAANKWLIGGAFVVLVVLFFVFDNFGISAYLQSHSRNFEPFLQYHIGYIKNNLENHLMNWSALVLNAPAPRINFISYGLLKAVYLLAGIASIAGLGYLLFRKNGNVPVVVKLYLICYAILLFNWPLFEPRLWVPVFPLSIAVMLQQEKMLSRFGKYAVASYKLIYILVGVVALSYYSYVSFNKKELAVKHDLGIWRNEYETHFFGRTLSDTATVVREPIVQILKKYD